MYKLVKELSAPLVESTESIAKDLMEGERKGKEIAKILSMSINLLVKNQNKFDSVMKQADEAYKFLSSFHNDISKDMHDSKDWDFKGYSFGEIKNKTGYDFSKIYEGVDREAFYRLQESVPMIREMKASGSFYKSLGLHMIFPMLKKISDDLLSRMEFAYNLAIVSVYHSEKRSEIIRILEANK